MQRQPGDGPRRLVPVGVARRVWWIVLAAVVLVGALGVHYAGQGGPGRVDRTLASLLAIRSHGALRAVAQGLADLGEVVPFVLGLGAVAVAGWLLHRWRGVVFALLAPVAAVLVTSGVLKPVIDRTWTGGLAYPSGHSVAVVSLAVVAAVFVLGARRSWALRIPVLAGLVVLCVAVPVALVARNYHYATDTVGGVGVALAVVLTTALTVDAAAGRFARRRGRAEREPLPTG